MTKPARIPEKSYREKTSGRKKHNKMHCDREFEAIGKRDKKLCPAVSKKPFDIGKVRIFINMTGGISLIHLMDYVRKRKSFLTK